jgi:hypothetical protein
MTNQAEYKNTIYDQLDSHVKSSYNISENDELTSVEDKDFILYFKNGLIIASFQLIVDGYTMFGPRYAAVEFDYRFKLDKK